LLPSFFGKLSDRLGRTALMAAGFLGTGLLYGLLPALPSFVWLVVLYTLSSVGWAISEPARGALISDLSTNETWGRIYGIYEFVSRIGATVGPLLGGWLYDNVGHDVPFYVTGVIMVWSAIAAYALLRQPSSNLSRSFKQKSTTQNTTPTTIAGAMMAKSMTTQAMTTEAGRVQLKPDAIDEGQECFVIATPNTTYYYQKEGCAFSSLIDRDGNDWLNYSPSKGAGGSFRGAPNMGNDFGHPGVTAGAKSWLSEERPDWIQITSASADGIWKVIWDFYPDRAVMTAKGIGPRTWLLYEGTPGGRFCPEEQYWFASDGRIRPCNRRFRGHLPNPKWVAFCDSSVPRSLVVSYKGKATQKDSYWPMKRKDGGMTVFGFGRSDILVPKMHINQAPFQFSIALMETQEYDVIKARVFD
jgi:hypothetical protein